MKTFGITNSSDNHALMATVGSRIRADAKMLAATATFWRLLGCGGLLLLGGIGVGLGCYGYAAITDQRATMAKLTTALADALNKVTLKTDGMVKIAPDSTVKLDTKGASVRLDGDGNSVPRPTPRQLDRDAHPPSKAPVVTDYTVFKTVRFDNGFMTTGWRYESSEDATPAGQFCYYVNYSDKYVSARYDIAIDGVMLPVPSGLPVDITQAFANCVWHSSTTVKRGERPT